LKKILFLLSIILYSCTFNNLMVGNGAKIESEKFYNGTGLLYDSHNYLVKKLQKESKLKMWDSLKYNQELKKLPPGGVLTVHIIRPTIGGASTDNFTVVIMQDGVEKERIVGEKNLPDASNLTENWISYFAIALNKKYITPFDVYIIDDLREERYHYKVSPTDL